METGTYFVVMQSSGCCMLYGPKVGIGSDCVVSMWRYCDLKDNLVKHDVKLPELATRQRFDFYIKSRELEFIA